MRTGPSVRFATFLRFVLALLLGVSAAAWSQTAKKCDVNNDGLINQTDINLIIAALNKPATGPGDPRDADNNGVINALDVRTCQLRCTLAACALPPTNTAPVAVNDTYSASEDTTLVILAPGVLSNDTDAQGDPLTSAVVTGPASGTLALGANGSFSYMPAPNFNGPVTFTYRANDGALNSNIATVTINVSALDDAPVAQPDTYATAEDTALAVAAPGVLANDGDVDNPVLTAFLVSGPSAAQGTLTFNSNGSFTFTPAANFSGAATFSYRASDGTLQSAVTLVTINVTPVDDAPVANGDAYSTDEDVPLVVAAPGVLGNDTDVDNANASLTAQLVNPPPSGVLILNADGSFTYTPAANFNGPASFVYRANDGFLNSNPATVALTILPVNDAPVAANDSYSTAANTALNVAAPGVLANDTDQEGNGLTAIMASGPAHGSLALNANGSFLYTPNANFSGADSFTYRANDGLANSNVATVTITVTAVVNTAPIAANDSYSTAEDTALTVAAPGVLGNDTDAQNNPLTAALVTGPTHGTLNLNANGSFTYAPNANFNGGDSFTYRASDGALNSNVATVSLAVTAVNDPPVAANDSYSTVANVPLSVGAPGVLANDTDVEGDPLTAVLGTGPAHGGLTLNANGSFTYTPATNFSGGDSFTYHANDGSANSDTATVAITVTAAPNTPPVANADSYSSPEDTPLVVNAAAGLLANDTDADGNPLTALLVAGPVQGNVTLNTDGSFTYTPPPQFNGPVTFTYRANDGLADSNVATVTINVTPVDDAPVANPDTYSTAEDMPLAVNALTGVLANDTDIDSVNLTAGLVSGPANGALTLNPNGSFTFTPNANFNGATTFSYRANDGTLNSNVATVTINVTPVDDAPIANADSYSTNEDTTLNVSAPGVLANDSDVDNSIASLTAILVTPPATGTLTLNADGSFTYIPQANTSGPVTFTYRTSDGTLQSTSATVTITVLPVNHAPVAANDNYSTNLNTPLTIVVPGILANDTDQDGNGLTAVLGTGPSSGVLALNANGSFTYTPNNGFTGTDTFTYRANDGTLNSNLATVTIAVASNLSVVSIVATTAAASEVGPTNGLFTVTRSGGNTTVALPLTVAITGTATNGVDYQTISGSVSIPAGQTSVTVPVNVFKDNLVEGNETVILTIQPSGTFNIGTASATVTIADDAAIVSIAATTAAASEVGPTNGLFTVTRSGGNTTVALPLTVAITGTATNGVDYQTISGSVSIPAGQTSVTVPVSVFKDNLVEGNETVILTIQPSGTFNIGTASATVTIADDPAIVSIAATTPAASEAGPTNGVFTVTRSGGNTTVALPLTVAIAGTATNGVDYQTISGSVSIPAGQTSVTVPVSVFKDNLVEGNETVILTIQPSGTFNIGTASATVTIADDAAIVSIAATTAAASEVGPTNGLFTITRSGGNTAVALPLSVAISGTATNGVDYQTISGSVSIPAGQTSVTVPVSVFKDNLVEGNETVILTIQPSGTFNIGTASATVTIADDPAIVSIAATTPAASEAGPTNGVFTVTRSGGNTTVALPLTVAIAGTATNGVDYQTISGSVSIPAGQSSTTITVVPFVDALVEGIETVILTIQPSSSFNIGTASATVNIADSPSAADVRMTMSVDNATPSVGQNVTFTVHAINDGPGAATGVVVQDQLPSGYTFVSSAGQGNYISGTGVWTIGSLSLNQDVVRNITATVLGTGSYTNTATRTASSPPDPNAANDSASVTPTPITNADIQVLAVPSTATPTVGQSMTVNVTATNLGPGVATGVVVQTLAPAGYTVVSAVPFAGSYNSTTGVWTIGGLAVNQVVTMQYTLTVLAAGPYNLTATKTASTPTDPNTGNDMGTAVVTPILGADIRVLAVPSTATPTVGQSMTVNVTATNLGPGVATGVVVQTLAPAGYTVVSAVPFAGSYNSTTGVWTIGGLAVNQVVTLQYTLTVLAAGPYNLTATKTASTPTDPNTGNDMGTAVVTPITNADIRVLAVPSTATPTVGQSMTVNVTATNLGPGVATGVVVQTLAPAGYTVVSAVPFAGSYNSTTGVWTIGGLAVNQVVTMQYTLTVLAAGPYNLTATKTASTPTDPNTGNDMGTAVVTPITNADIQVLAVPSTATPTVGQSMTVNVTATNLGPGVATGVVVQTLAPAGYTVVSAVPFAGSYNSTTGVWTIGGLAVNQVVTMQYTLTVLAAGPYNLTATKTASTPTDLNSGNDMGTAVVTPITNADIRVLAVPSTATPTVGQSMTVNVTATNLGPGVATGVVVQTLAPAGYTVVSAVPFAGSYNSTTGVWTIGGLAVNQVVTMQYTLTVLAAGPYNLTATKTASTPTDLNTGNDMGTAVVTPITNADIQVLAVPSTATPTVGQSMTVNVTATNLGPGVATGVVVQTLAPAGYTVVSAVPFAGSYNSTTGVWTIGGLAVNQVVTLQYTLTVLAAGPYNLTATKTASTPTDPNTGNDMGTAVVTPH